MCYEEVLSLCRVAGGEGGGGCRQGSGSVRFVREELNGNCVTSYRVNDVVAT